jgi:hypothetical protein
VRQEVRQVPDRVDPAALTVETLYRVQRLPMVRLASCRHRNVRFRVAGVASAGRYRPERVVPTRYGATGVGRGIIVKMTASNPKRLSLVVAAAYAVLVVVALVVTLRSLSGDDFDGLNSMLQVPLALPWWIIVPAPWSHTTDAWLTAGLGLMNAVFVYLLLRRFLEERTA